ncbi:MAG: LamG domain-containing protein [Nanoarchaeota archaeon]|nr:LamG domain-containing protein [Nanoarchaeota archaeon]
MKNGGLLFLVVGIFMLGVVGAATYDVAFVSYWEFNGDVNDSVGNNDGTIVGGASVSGGVLVLNGVDSYVSVPDSSSLDIELGVTLSAWVKPVDLVDVQGIITKNGPYFLELATDRIGQDGFVIHNVTGWQGMSGTTLLASDAWTHVLYTYDGGTGLLQFYVNGVPGASKIIGGNLLLTNAPVFIGARSGTPSSFFEGSIDDAMIFNRSLTPAEVTEIYNLGTKHSCPLPDQTIMKLSQQNNSHGALWDDTNYDWDICYDGPAPGIPHPTCTAENSFLWLSSASNAHASLTESVDYPIGVCYGNLVCHAVQDPTACGAGETAIVRLFEETNSHLSDVEDTDYPWKICCSLGSQVRWEDMDGVTITESKVGKMVRMVQTNTLSGDFEIKDQDGDTRGDNDDDIRTADVGGVIVGTEQNGDLVGVWKITQANFDLVKVDGDLANGGIEAYFIVNSEESLNLNISEGGVDEPMNVTLDSPPCGEDFILGSTTYINVSASDPDDLIIGNVSIDGINVMNFSNGGGSILHTWDWSGNVQVELFAVNSRGYRRRVVTSVMIVDDNPEVDANYVAACITKPADFSDIDSNNVRFDASTSRGLKCTNGNNCGTPIDYTGLWFSWRFSDGLVNLNHDGATEPESYKFFKNFIQAGRNWAELDVEIVA